MNVELSSQPFAASPARFRNAASMTGCVASRAPVKPADDNSRANSAARGARPPKTTARTPLRRTSSTARPKSLVSAGTVTVNEGRSPPRIAVAMDRTRFQT